MIERDITSTFPRGMSLDGRVPVMDIPLLDFGGVKEGDSEIIIGPTNTYSPKSYFKRFGESKTTNFPYSDRFIHSDAIAVYRNEEQGPGYFRVILSPQIDQQSLKIFQQHTNDLIPELQETFLSELLLASPFCEVNSEMDGVFLVRHSDKRPMFAIIPSGNPRFSKSFVCSREVMQGRPILSSWGNDKNQTCMLDLNTYPARFEYKAVEVPIQRGRPDLDNAQRGVDILAVYGGLKFSQDQSSQDLKAHIKRSLQPNQADFELMREELNPYIRIEVKDQYV